MLGLDWRTADLSDYLEAMEAHAAAQPDSGNGKAKPASEGLKNFMRAHGLSTEGGGKAPVGPRLASGNS